jgi:hypothetical protein
MKKSFFLICLIVFLTAIMFVPMGCGDDDDPDDVDACVPDTECPAADSCGTMDDGCGGTIDCPIAEDGCPSSDAGISSDGGTSNEDCFDNVCRVSKIWRCDALNYGAVACVDYLELDGWNPVEADANCVISSPDESDTYPIFGEVLEAASCKDTYVPLVPPTKRCIATMQGTDTMGVSEPSYAEPYYMYAPSYFPDTVCENNLGGTIDGPPFPAY